MGHPDRAQQALDKALEMDAELVQAINSMGTLKVQMGDFDQAIACFKRALELKPDDTVARVALTQASKTTADDHNLQQLQTQVAELEDQNSIRAMSIHFALGKCFDDLKQADKAFPHFLKGCQIKRSKIDYDATAQDQHTQAIIDFFNPDTIEQLSGAGNDSELPVFIVGMPRSGTTLTEQIISSHPLVHGAGELPDLLQIANRPRGEQGAIGFPQSLQGLNQDILTSLGTRYETGLRQRCADALRITDKMPANFFCVGLIHLILPNAKIIHIKRNPVDTCLSGFSRLFNHGQMHSYDLTEIGLYYRSYHRLMQHWRQILPANSFMEIDYETLVADIENQSRQLIDYVGLEWDGACLDFHNNKRSIRTASVAQVRRPIYNSSVARWKSYEPYLEPLLEALGDLVPNTSS
jgi:tetratricopeptide (TPR) repeat protein